MGNKLKYSGYKIFRHIPRATLPSVPIDGKLTSKNVPTRQDRFYLYQIVAVLPNFHFYILCITCILDYNGLQSMKIHIVFHKHIGAGVESTP